MNQTYAKLIWNLPWQPCVASDKLFFLLFLLLFALRFHMKSSRSSIITTIIIAAAEANEKETMKERERASTFVSTMKQNIYSNRTNHGPVLETCFVSISLIENLNLSWYTDNSAIFSDRRLWWCRTLRFVAPNCCYKGYTRRSRSPVTIWELCFCIPTNRNARYI